MPKKKQHNNRLHVAGRSHSHKKHLILFGLASLAWFIFRTGTKPSRIVYPCQKAALANGSMLLGLTIPLWLAASFTKTKRFAGRRGITLLTVITIGSLLLSVGEFLQSTLVVDGATPNQELSLSLSSLRANSAISNLYVVNGRTQAHIANLISLMGANGLKFFESATSGATQGPNGLIARDDVVLIKVNEEWPYRGGTSTDLLKELILSVFSHPEGFAGEIIVADNGQWQGSLDWPESNAEDHTQSTQDVVNQFSNVSAYDWIPIRDRRVQEYSAGDLNDGYIVYGTADPETGMIVSYPKFRTQFGTYVSFKEGIWNGTGYEKRLKIINMPVLKSHGDYGVTGALKHYMGVQSQGEGQVGLGNGHSSVATGGMGTMMVETGFPTLNIVDSLWVNANPPGSSGAGPSTPYDMATRVNVILAGTDPVALDHWAAKHVLVQAASLIGYTDTHSIDPDNTIKTGVRDEAFGVWLSRAENEILNHGYSVTSDESKMNVYLPGDSPAPTPTPNPSPTASPEPSPTPTPTPTPPSILNSVISCNSLTSFSNFKIEVEGRIAVGSSGLSGLPLSISYRLTNETTWRELASVKTDGSGNFLTAWVPSIPGNYLIRAQWTGNTTFAATEALVNLAAVPYEETAVISVSSNSTLSNLGFDPAIRQLNFSAAAPSNTSGYAEVYIAKSLVENVTSLEVYVDNQKVGYSAESLEDSWVLHFTYQHSAHTITISLGSSSVSVLFPVELLIAGGIAVVAVISVLSIVLFLRRRKRLNSV